MTGAVATARRVRSAQRARARRRIVLRSSARQVGPPTVLLLTPDFQLPSAGIRTLYRHADILASAGIPASVLHHQPGFRCDWFDNSTPVTDVTSRVLGPDDLLVVGERDVDVLVHHRARTGQSLRHVVLDQSGYLAWDHSPDDVVRHYASGHGPLALLATSRHVAQVARFAHPGLDVRQVRLSVDRQRFHPAGRVGAPDGTRPPLLSYMPRRGAEDVSLVLRLLAERATLSGWEIRPLSAMGADEVADALRNSDIFLSVSHREGFGMPPLEAMACGAYVVGYDALGGREFFRPEHCSAVETGNVLALARALATAVERESDEPGWLASRGRAAAAFAHDEYSPEREADSVLVGYAGLLTSGG